MSKEMMRWADPAQFLAEPIEKNESGVVEPKVYLLWMTPEPLRVLAAVNHIYTGRNVRDLMEVDIEDALYQYDQAQKNPLKAPYEAIRFHFLLEGVDRTFTHQLVRQRTAAYAQESLRFAVKENAVGDTTMPLTIARLAEDDPRRVVWERALEQISEAYEALVNNDIPSEDARGLLPHAIATRIHYMTDLRGLTYHAGRRLCTQSQYHWRVVFAKIIAAIRDYEGPGSNYVQQQAIANSFDFRPVCFQENRCPFQDDSARDCNIKERVEWFTAHGIKSDRWDDPNNALEDLPVIRPEEWLMNPDAGRGSRV